MLRGEGNSVTFINREILPGPEDARICLTLFFKTTTREFSEIQRNILLIMNICEILLFCVILFVCFCLYFLWVGELKSTIGEIGALKR